MKHLLTLAALLVSTLSLAQQMPYNPDANGDDFVGVDDVLGVLGVYDTALMQPDLQCDYEGTEIEELFIGLVDFTITLDSVYVEYSIRDTLAYFTPGCPDLILEPILLERAFMATASEGSGSCNYLQCQSAHVSHFGFLRDIRFEYNENNNGFELRLFDGEVNSILPSFNSNGTSTWWSTSTGDAVTLPFPENWTIDEDGFQIDWRPGQWVSDCEHFRFIPFWHEAE